jgi:hypothetical protein
MTMKFFAVILLGLGLAPLLFLHGALGAEADKLESSQIRIDNQVVTVYTYSGQSYRFTTPDALAAPAIAGQLVCLEGKLREVRGTDFTLYGTDRKFQATTPEVLKGVAAGDNVWIGGRVTSASLAAHVVVKLKSDLALFDDRFAAASTEKSWEKMLDLAAWISRSKAYNPGIAFEELRRYRATRDRAVVAACSMAEAAFQESDAAGYSRLAARLLDLDLDNREIVWRYFRQAALLDPDQELACRKLAEAGYLRWHGQWLTRAEKQEREVDEAARAARTATAKTARQLRRAEEAASGTAAYTRESAELETAIASLPPADAALRLATALERASSPRLGRRIIFLIAGLPLRHQADPLAAALASREPEVRCAALEFAATRNDLPARNMIAQAAAADSTAEVVELACQLLAAAGDGHAVGKLVELTASDKEFRSSTAVEVLQKVTSQDRWTPVEWRIWWNRNKSAYPPGPAQ